MRLYSFIAVCSIFTCVAGIASAQATSPPPTDDTQLWSDVQLTVPLKKKVDLILTGTFRLGRNLTNPIEERGAISLAFKANNYLTFETGYLYIATQSSKIRRNYENRLVLSGTIKFPIGKFTLSDRSQFERRFRNSQSDSTRYRNRLRVEYPVVVGSQKFNVFASNEIFYDWSVNKWIRNRFAVGANKKLSQRLTAEVYYMRQNDGRSRPGDLHVIGTIFKVQL